MNDILLSVGSAISEYIIEEFPRKYLENVFGGSLEIDDLIDQVILECIKFAYDSTQEKHSIRYYLKQNADEENADVRMKYSRLMSIVNEAKKNELAFFRQAGYDVREHEVQDMVNMPDKLEGYKLSEMNFFEITNVGELELIKAIINHRIMYAKKIPNDKFKEIANQYDKYVLTWRELSQDNDKNMVFYSLAYFTIEWKYAFNFLYSCLDTMDKAGIWDEDEIISRIGMLFGYKSFSSALGFDVSIDSRMIGFREKLIPLFLNSARAENQYSEMLALVAWITKNIRIDDLPIKEWFIKNTTLEDWASFVKEYDVFKHVPAHKNWSGKYIAMMRRLMARVFPENPEKRSYTDGFSFDTIVLSKLKEEINLDKFECYIEEYENKQGKLCARIREKKSNKRIEMLGDSFVKMHFLRFLSQAKVNLEIMPTVYEREGTDIVSVRGKKQSEDDERIVVSLTGIGSGYLFE